MWWALNTSFGIKTYFLFILKNCMLHTLANILLVLNVYLIAKLLIELKIQVL